MKKIKDNPLLLYLRFLFLIPLTTNANEIGISGAAGVNYGSSYDFYDYSENLIDLNLFYKNIQGWVQYEYSNPPEIGL